MRFARLRLVLSDRDEPRAAALLLRAGSDRAAGAREDYCLSSKGTRTASVFILSSSYGFATRDRGLPRSA